MIFTANHEKPQMDSHSYQYASDNGLLSLLQYPLPSLEATSSYASSLTNVVSEPHCFEDPFDDPTMEPAPLGPDVSGDQQDPLLPFMDDMASPEPFLLTDNCLSYTSSFMQLNNPSVTNLQQGLINILGPVLNTFQSKRGLDDIFTSGNQGPRKRQRTSHMHTAAVCEENTARFRPYQEQQWRAQFQKIIQFKLENGHCCVPHSYPDDPILARWVKRQRYQFKKFNDSDPTSTMTTRRIQELTSIGFVWHSHASAWQEKLNELKAFKQQTGHCNVPSHYPQHVALSTWVKCQRRQYKLYISGAPSNMTIERFQELESLGFVFDVSKAVNNNW